MANNSINPKHDQLSFKVTTPYQEHKIEGSDAKVYVLDLDFGDDKTVNMSIRAKSLKVALEAIEVFARQVEKLNKEDFEEYKKGNYQKPFHISIVERDVDHVTIYKNHRLSNPEHVLDYAFYTKMNGSRRMVKDKRVGVSVSIKIEDAVRKQLEEYERELKSGRATNVVFKFEPPPPPTPTNVSILVSSQT